MHYTYILFHPISLFIPIYVGITNRPDLRLEQHKKDKGKRICGIFTPWMLVIGAYRSRRKCEHAENVWIDMCKRFNLPIRNKAKTRIDTRFSLTFWIVPFLRLCWVTARR